MSSEVISVSTVDVGGGGGSATGDVLVGGIAAAVALPVGVAFGAGWLAWQAGKLAINLNDAVNEEIERKKREMEATARQRKAAAVAAHEQLLQVCEQVLAECRAEFESQKMTASEYEQIKFDINSIRNTPISDDTSKIESSNSRDFLVLEQIVQRKKRIEQMVMSGINCGEYKGLALMDLMDDMRKSFASVKVRAMEGKDIRIADPEVLERAKLNEKLYAVSGRVVAALEHVNELAKKYGFTTANTNWFQSCFIGVDTLLEKLCQPTTSNGEIKKGIKHLTEIMERYDMAIPGINKEYEKKAALYAIYVDASKALAEPYCMLSKFKSSAEIEKRLNELKERAARAEECAKLYKKLGRTAYISFAIDQELKNLGYTVHTKKDIVEKTSYEPQRAVVDGKEIPYYEWNEDAITQIYSMAENCALQVVVQEEGPISLQAIAELENPVEVAAVKETQRNHCSQIPMLYENLKKNWGIHYDYNVAASSEEIMDLVTWKDSPANEWKAETPQKKAVAGKKRKEEKIPKHLEMK